MHLANLHYFPLSLPFFFILVALFVVVLILVQLKILRYAYTAIGIDRRYVLFLLLLSLLGSYVNIPVAQLPAEQVVTGKEVIFFGMRYVVPVVQDWPGTMIAVNVGGAVIPTILSLYLLIQNKLYIQGFWGILIVTIVCHLLSHPVPGLGIAEPVFVPPIITTIAALLLSRQHAAPLAVKPRQDSRIGRSHSLHWRRRYIRRNFCDRHSCRNSGQLRRCTAKSSIGKVNSNLAVRPSSPAQ
jgi:uncharacterized membrane protein